MTSFSREFRETLRRREIIENKTFLSTRGRHDANVNKFSFVVDVIFSHTLKDSRHVICIIQQFALMQYRKILMLTKRSLTATIRWNMLKCFVKSTFEKCDKAKLLTRENQFKLARWWCRVSDRNLMLIIRFS